ncbi:unnamed protein product [Alternaria alternata]
MTHKPALFCTHSGCKYSLPFASQQNLRKHIRDFHDSGPKAVSKGITRRKATLLRGQSGHTPEPSPLGGLDARSQAQRLTKGPSKSLQQDQVTAKLHHFVQHYRFQQQQGKIPHGWQQGTPPEERGQLALQFFTQYRLLKPEIAEVESLRAALQFETQTFMSSKTKDEYVSDIKQKLIVMTTARQQQPQQQPQQQVNQRMQQQLQQLMQQHEQHEAQQLNKPKVNKKYYRCAVENCRNNKKTWPRLDNFKQHIERMHKGENVLDVIERSTCHPKNAETPMSQTKIFDSSPTLNNYNINIDQDLNRINDPRAPSVESPYWELTPEYWFDTAVPSEPMNGLPMTTAAPMSSIIDDEMMGTMDTDNLEDLFNMDESQLDAFFNLE